jgi:hypothetical protein
MQLAIEDYPANNLPKVQEIVTFASDLESSQYLGLYFTFFLF